MTPTRKSILIIAAAAAADAIGRNVQLRTGFDVFSIAPGSGRLGERLRTLRPTAVVLSILPPETDWPRTIQYINRQDNPPGVVVVTAETDTTELLSAFREGADAYLSMDAIQGSLLPALSAVRNRFTFFRRRDATAIREHLARLEKYSVGRPADLKNGTSSLTVREAEIFPLLAEGKSVKAVARLLRLSPKTVETHKYHIFEKLKVANISELTRLAIRKKLIPP